MPKHGIEQHFVRPDRVYATGVWSPTAGYQPAEDAMQVAARFVSGGQGRTTLAGPQAQVTLLGRGFRAPMTLRERWDTFVARVRARIDSSRIRRELKALPAAAAQVVLDTSPRPAAPSPMAIPTQGAWAPAAQSPASAAASIGRGKAPDSAPLLPAPAAAAQLAPSSIGFPAAYWQDVISRGLPPMVAARSENDALRIFYSNRFPGQGY